MIVARLDPMTPLPIYLSDPAKALTCAMDILNPHMLGSHGDAGWGNDQNHSNSPKSWTRSISVAYNAPTENR